MPLGLTVLLAVLATVGRLMAGNWLAPAAFFPLVWAVLMGIAAALQATNPLQPEGLGVFVSASVAVLVGGLVVHHAAKGPGAAPSHPTIDDNLYDMLEVRLVRATAVTSLLAAIGVAGLVVTGSVTFGIDFSLVGLLRLGNLFSVLRYGGVNELPVSVRAFMYWAFSAALLGGMLAAVTETRARRVLSLVPLVLSLAIGIVVAARAGFLLTLVMWMSGYWSVQVFRTGGKYTVFRAKWILGVVVAVGSLLGVSVAFQWLRAGIWRGLPMQAFVTGTLGDFFGCISAFTTWYATHEPQPLALGALTFAGPFDLFGLAPRARGLYDLSVTFLSGRTSNIYTMFRGLVEDFGVLGVWGVCFAGGAMGTLAYLRCAAGRVQWAVPLSLFYGIALFSNLSSVFVYNSVIVGWLVAAAVMLWPARIWSVRPGPEAVALAQTHDYRV